MANEHDHLVVQGRSSGDQEENERHGGEVEEEGEAAQETGHISYEKDESERKE